MDRLPSSNPDPSWLEPSSPGAALETALRQDLRLFAIAARVAQEFTRGGVNPRTEMEEMVGSGLPGDTHGRLGLDPEPFRGRNLSKNPHPKISPQTMPATIERPFSGVQVGAPSLKLTTKRGQWAEVSLNDDNPRHQTRHSTPLRNLARRG